MPTYNAGDASLRIIPDASGFRAKLETDLRKIQAEYAVQVSADLDRARADLERFRAEQHANPINLPVHTDTSQARRELTRLGSDWDKVKDKFASGFSWNIAASGVSLLPSLATGLAEVAQAMQQVAQAGLLLPGVFAGVGSSVASLLVGVSGVKDAYSALSRATDDTTSSQAQAVSQTNRLRDAVADETRAQRDVAQARKDARQQLEDLNLSLRGGALDEKQAILDAAKARRDLVTGQYKDALDYQQAQLRVLQADQRVAEAHQRNIEVRRKAADANAKGIEGSDAVVNANERLRRSHEQVQQAQAGSGTEMAKASDALAKLSPNARAFVQTLVELKPQLRELRNADSQNLFAGLSGQLKTLAQQDLPILQKGLAGIATGWNHNLKALMGSLSSDSTKGLLDRILGDTGAAQERFTKAIDPIVHAIGTLTAAGADALPRLADGVGKVAERFDHFISAAAEDGRLDKWINDGITGLDHLGNIVINLGKSFNAVTKAVGGKGLLGTLDEASRKLAAFLNSDAGQSKLRAFFDDGRRELSLWLPILKDLPGMFYGAFRAARDVTNAYLPILTKITDLLSAHPGLIHAVATAFLGWKTITPITSAIGVGVQSLSGFLTDVRTRAAETGAVTAKSFVKAAGQEGVGKLSGALSLLGGAGGPLGILATAAIPAVTYALDEMGRKNREAAETARALNEAEIALGNTLDQVTGKVTRATREQAIRGAQNYNASGAGGGIDGISKGNSVEAAGRLGIAPDLYADALTGNPDAIKRVKDVLVNNNLSPEFAANSTLKNMVDQINKNRFAGTHELSTDVVIRALIGDPDALRQFNDNTNDAILRAKNLTLADIGKQLSATGKDSQLVGGALNSQLRAFPGAQARVGEQNQAEFGRYRLTDQGKGFFGADATVASSGQDLKITAPHMTPGLQAELQASNLPHIQNADGSITVTVPLNAPFVEKYDKGGPTPLGRGPGPTGGYLAEVHPNEYVISGRGRARVPDSFLHALNTGIVDPATLPKFDQGGPTDDLQPGLGALGPSMPLDPPPVAPNPIGGGTVSSVLGAVSSGLSGPIGNAVSLGGNLFGPSLGAAGIPGLGGGAARGQTIPGLWGLFQSGGNPQALSAWTSQTVNWLANWGTQTVSSGAQILGQGALSGLGLQNSILSPSNVYNQAIQRTAGFYLGQQGPLAALSGGVGGAGDEAGLGSQGLTLGDGSTIQIPTFGTSQGVSASDLQAVLGGGGTLSPAALRAIGYAQAHAVGQPYVYGGVGPNGYDCSGIGSAIYAAAEGLPQGTRYFTTESNFAALGFQPGYVPGDLNIGLLLGGGGPNSHMTLTLPNGINVESGGASDSTQYGGSAAGALSLPVHWHLALPGDRAVGAVPGLYDQGGWLPPGLNLTANYTGKPEGILTHQQTQAVQAIATAATQPSPPPGLGGASDVTAGHLNSPPQQPPPQQPSLPPQNIPTAPPPPTPTAPTPPENQQLYIPPDIAEAPSSLDHNLPAVSTAIKSGASTIGNLAAMAINAAAAAATMGAGAGTAGIGSAGGGLAGAGASSLGSFVSGLIQEGGKIVNDAVNVGSSFLVGNVPGSTGTQDLAYGRTLRPTQNTPNTAPTRIQNNEFHGMDVNRVFAELDIRDAQAHQAALAGNDRR